MPGDDRPTRRPYGLADLALVLGIVVLAGALRVTWCGGLGLADDLIFRGEINSIVVSQRVAPDNQAYRFLWWLPVAVSARLFGVNSFGLVLPFTLTSLLGLVFVYLIGRELWGRAAGALGALLAAFTPIDFAWSTLMTPDVMQSTAWAATVWLTLRALAADEPGRRRRAWFLTALTFWLSVHAKLSGLFLAPALALTLLVQRRRLGREVWTLFVTGAVLFCGTLVVSYALWGDPLFGYHSELKFQGLTGTAATVRRLTADNFWHFPERLTLPDVHGNLYFGVLPYAVVLLPLLALVAGTRPQVPILIWGWLVFPLLGFQFNIQRVDGVWVAGFRNLRHILPLVYPMALIAAAGLWAMQRRWRWVAGVLGAAVLVVGAQQSVSVAAKFSLAFAERREACRFLAALPSKPARVEPSLATWCGLDPVLDPPELIPLPPNPQALKAALAAVTRGYVVTGGGVAPLYGCFHCMLPAGDLPASGFRLLRELDGPIQDPWRREPLRIWERVPDDSTAAPNPPPAARDEPGQPVPSPPAAGSAPHAGGLPARRLDVLARHR